MAWCQTGNKPIPELIVTVIIDELSGYLAHHELSGYLAHHELSGYLAHHELSGYLAHHELSGYLVDVWYVCTGEAREQHWKLMRVPMMPTLLSLLTLEPGCHIDQCCQRWQSWHHGDSHFPANPTRYGHGFALLCFVMVIIGLGNGFAVFYHQLDPEEEISGNF